MSTIKRLVTRAKATATKLHENSLFAEGVAKTRKFEKKLGRRVEVWCVKYQTADDGEICYALYHYGEMLLTAVPMDGSYELNLEAEFDLSYSDRGGMAAFAKVLGVKNYTAPRKGLGHHS